MVHPANAVAYLASDVWPTCRVRVRRDGARSYSEFVAGIERRVGDDAGVQAKLDAGAETEPYAPDEAIATIRLAEGYGYRAGMFVIALHDRAAAQTYHATPQPERQMLVRGEWLKHKAEMEQQGLLPTQ